MTPEIIDLLFPNPLPTVEEIEAVNTDENVEVTIS